MKQFSAPAAVRKMMRLRNMISNHCEMYEISLRKQYNKVQELCFYTL
jgi:hypothetical protein